MSFGLSPWGLSPWGLTPLPIVQLVSAVPSGDCTLLVTFSNPPLAKSPIGEGDALNPLSWVLVRGDGFVFLVMNVRQVSAIVYELYALQKFSSVLVEHNVAAVVFKPSGGYIDEPSSLFFLGLVASHPATTQPSMGVDLSNPAHDTNRPGGTLLVDASGDYVNEGGLAFFKKLIIRRLTTSLGAFFHLTDYGTNLRLKEPLPISDMVKLQAQITIALQREPEFQSVGTRLSLDADGTLLIEVSVKLITGGAQLVVPVTASPALVQL